MNNQKVCISKQVTFVSLVLLLLIVYVFAAYRTMSNRTSTNSRATAQTKKILPIQSPIMAPYCYDPSLQQICLSPVYSQGINKLELNLSETKLTALKEDPNSQEFYHYVVMSAIDDKYTFLNMYPSKDIVSQSSLHLVFDSANNPVTVHNGDKFIIVGISSSQLNEGNSNKCVNPPDDSLRQCVSVRRD